MTQEELRPCTWCKCLPEDHDYEQLARQCFPKQIKELEAEKKDLEELLATFKTVTDKQGARILELEAQVTRLQDALDGVSQTGGELTVQVVELKAEKKRLERLCAGALCSLLRESWQPGPTESEIQDELWRYLDDADNDFPLSKKGITDDKRIEYLAQLHSASVSGEK